MNRIVITLILVCFSLKTYAQNRTIHIYFGETIPQAELSGYSISQCSWEISLQGSTMKTGTSDDLFVFKFDSPGLYTVNFKDNHQHRNDVCNHFNLPSSITINVSSTKINYLLDKVKFSNEIRGNIDCAGIVMYVPIEIISNGEVEINDTITSYGINTNITGVLKETQKRLKSGNHILEYVLQGSTERGVYMGFDFYDTNGHVISYSLRNPIN